MHVPHQLTRLDTQHCALNIIYNSFGFYLFVPYLTSLRTTLTWAFDHQRQNFPSCRIVRKYILKYDAKQNYRIRFQHIIALLWSAEMLLNYFQGNTGATGTRILVYFTGILMWAQPVFFFRRGGRPGGLFLYPLWLNGAHSAVWFELSFFLTQVSKLSMTFKTDVVTSSNKRYNSYKGLCPHGRFRLWWVKIL